MSNTLVVTRHAGLVADLIASAMITADAEVVSHASPEAVTGKDVWGVLPHNLSCLCNSFTEVPLDLPPELRGKELSEEEVRRYASPPVTYKVLRL